MTRPSITVITPSFNQAAFLGQTIESVLGQNYPNLEYLIFDGLSTDGSVDLIRRYSNRISSWVSRKDRGQSDAINQGMRQAKGDIVCWINSDDYLCPGALDTVATYFETHPDVLWLIGGCELLNDRNPPHEIRRAPENLTPRNLMAWWPNYGFCQQSTFWRRSLLESAGLLDENLHYMMDWDLWLRFFAVGRPAILKEVLAGYRYHSAAKCVVATNQLLLEELAVHQKILDANPGEPLAAFKTESTERLLVWCNELARRNHSPRNFPTGDLLRECGNRVVRKATQLFKPLR